MITVVRTMSVWNGRPTELVLLAMARSVTDLLRRNSRYPLTAISTYIPEWTINLCPCYCDFHRLHDSEGGRHTYLIVSIYSFIESATSVPNDALSSAYLLGKS
jgi:hypothetical protein